MTEQIALRGGQTVLAPALELALDLEAAGHKLTVVDGRLIVSNGRELSPERQAQIRALKFHLIALVAYQPPEGDR